MRIHHGEQGTTACRGFQWGVKEAMRQKVNPANALSSWVLHTHTQYLSYLHGTRVPGAEESPQSVGSGS